MVRAPVGPGSTPPGSELKGAGFFLKRPLVVCFELYTKPLRLPSVKCTWPMCPGHPVACPGSQPLGPFLDRTTKRFFLVQKLCGRSFPHRSSFFYITVKPNLKKCRK